MQDGFQCGGSYSLCGGRGHSIGEMNVENRLALQRSSQYKIEE